MQGFMRGINLDGWLSQYAEYDDVHFRAFVTESDIAQIASWGLDHVRLPVECPVRGLAHLVEFLELADDAPSAVGRR